MTILRIGSKGSTVKSLQAWLVGRGYLTAADGQFGPVTERAVKMAQVAVGVTADGVVGPATTRAFAAAGWAQVAPAALPPLPSFKSLSGADRQRVWGTILAEPLANRSDIRITNDWVAKNLTKVEVPQLRGVLGAPKDCRIYWHKRGVVGLLGFFQDIERAGLLHLVKSWAGSWVPRYVRGSTTTLSSHAHATAFDINAAWNGLNEAPAPAGSVGSVVDLVPIAHTHKFFWGGHFKRPDGMHFEQTEADS